MSESNWWYLFYKEVKSWDSFEQRQFQTPVWKRYTVFEFISRRNASFLGANDLYFWKEGGKIIPFHLTCDSSDRVIEDMLYLKSTY